MISCPLLEDAGKLVLRLTIAGLMLFHGLHKLTHGIGRISITLESRGLPRFIAYGVYVGEIVAPVFMLLGWWTRPAAVIFAINMLVAVWLVHMRDVGRLATTGGWALELQALYFLGSLAIALLGAGRFSISRGRGRWH
jgi:putative oxidoreductase